ncbi:MAG: tetratricopeptide repeat protein [Deltaproteobacteria bacterium]|nr:tetratricopeptide repeat protein [Deltaproteobacteria bacterium]
MRSLLRAPAHLAAALAFTLAVTAAAPPLVAAGDTGDKVLAEQLFKDAKTLMDKKKFSDACPKLEESYKLDPVDGTQLRLALCYQELGRWASASLLYHESLKKAQKAGRKDRIDLAERGIAEVDPKIAYLTVNVPAEIRLPGLQVNFDDKILGESIWGSPFPVDPGPHTIRATAPNHAPWESKVTVGITSENKTATVPRLAPATTAPKDTGAPKDSSAPKDTGGVRPEVPEPASNKGLAIASFVVGGVFLAGGVGARIAFGNAKDDYFADCAQQLSYTCDNPDGRARVRTWEALSFVGFGVGAAAIGVGVVLLATSKEKKPAAAITAAPIAGGAGLSLSGAF